jgi:hypothetical protein
LSPEEAADITTFAVQNPGNSTNSTTIYRASALTPNPPTACNTRQVQPVR